MVLIARNLKFQFPGKAPLWQNINLTLTPGTFNLLTGPSGCGKSTLLKCLAHLFPKFTHGQLSGSITINGKPLSKGRNQVAMLFQDPNYQFTMKTVQEEMIFTLENEQVPSQDILPAVNHYLNRLHLTNLKKRTLATLSGGEKQKVALAITLAIHAQIILLDEPFTNVDQRSRQQILALLKRFKQHGKTILIVDHDLRDYQSLTDHVFRLKQGTLTELQSINWPQSQPIKNQWPLPKLSLPATFTLRKTQLKCGSRTLINCQQLKLLAHHITLLTGANGTGKSTLFKALAKLFQYDGSIIFHNQELRRIKAQKYYRQVKLGFQEAENQFLQITVREELQLSLQHATRHLYQPDTLQQWLKMAELSDHLNQSVYTLSGGQKKVLQLMVLILMGAPVLLLDEPFQNLDPQQTAFCRKLLKQACVKHATTIFIISHQLDLKHPLATYHLCLTHQQLTYQRGLQA